MPFHRDGDGIFFLARIRYQKIAGYGCPGFAFERKTNLRISVLFLFAFDIDIKRTVFCVFLNSVKPRQLDKFRFDRMFPFLIIAIFSIREFLPCLLYQQIVTQISVYPHKLSPLDNALPISLQTISSHHQCPLGVSTRRQFSSAPTRR